MVSSCFANVVNACRQRGFEAKKLLAELQAMPQTIEGETKDSVFGQDFIASTWRVSDDLLCQETFYTGLINTPNNNALIWVISAARRIGDYQLAHFVQTEIEKVYADKGLSSKHRADIEPLMMRLRNIDNCSLKLNRLIRLCSGSPSIARLVISAFQKCNDAEIASKRLFELFPDDFINSEPNGETKQKIISKLLAVILEEGTQQFRKRYLAILLFNENSVIEVCDLAVLWQCSSEEALEQAEEFCKRSLASMINPSKEPALLVDPYLYRAALEFAAMSHLKVRETLVQQTNRNNCENVLHKAISLCRFVLLACILPVLTNPLCSAQLIFETCGHWANGRTPLHYLLKSDISLIGGELYTANWRPLPVLCQLIERTLFVDWTRAMYFLKSGLILLPDLIGTIRDGAKWYENAFLTAAANSYKALAGLLLDEGANINTVDDFGCNVLIKAAENNQHEIISEKFLKHGRSSELKVDSANVHGETALMVACKFGHFQTVKVLLAKCDPKLWDKTGNTALHHAAVKGQAEIVQLLLTKHDKGTINLANKKGETALSLATSAGSHEICDMLKKAGENSPISEEKRIGIQNQLILILHAHKCTKREALANSLNETASSVSEHSKLEPYQCKVPYCSRMKDVIVHLRTCSNSVSCTYRSCISTRQIVLHWQTCRDVDCPVCREIRQLATLSNPVFATKKNKPLSSSDSGYYSSTSSQTLDSNKSDTAETVAVAGSMASASLPWQHKFSEAERQSVIAKFVKDLLAGAMMTQDEEEVKPFAKETESEIFKRANSRDQYFYLLGERLYTAQKQLLHTGGTAEPATDAVTTCPICFGVIVPLACSTRRLKCGHTYHMECINRWLKQDGRCPYCREQILLA